MGEKKLISLLLIVVCMIPLVACESLKEKEEINVKSEQATEKFDKTKNISEEKVKDTEYAKDKVVNNFIANYNSFSNSPIINIKRGNIRTKYFGETYGYAVEMLNANDTNKIVITINKTNENADIGMEGMKEIFHDSIKAIITDESEEYINRYFDDLLKNEYMVTKDAFNELEIMFFLDRELSKGLSSGHIKIRAK